ncbi:MAG: serine acetyltransferase [Deltaproteobacteria bacterium]|nr:serine acetyltransferase [Deltaproteobacteria bacterium]
MASNPIPRSLRRAGADSAGPGGEPFACPEEVLAAAIEGLAGCEDTVLSETVCGGILDPNEVGDWVDRTKRLLRFRVDEAELRFEVPAVADGLHELLLQVDLPPRQSAEEITIRFVASLVEMRTMLSLDVEAAYDGDPAAKGYDEIVVAYPAIRALAIHRIAHQLSNYGVPLLPRIMSEYAHDRTGIDIHPGAQIGERFFIDHGTGVVIGETAVIGDRVRLYQGVTLGATSLRDSSSLRGKKRHPTIEDDVTIYAGATILGGETVIGEGSIIGGNVWLTQSVPKGSRVMAEAPRQRVQKPGEGSDVLGESNSLNWDI